MAEFKQKILAPEADDKKYALVFLSNVRSSFSLYYFSVGESASCRHEYQLVSSDKSYDEKISPTDGDLLTEDGRTRVQFEDLVPGLRYSLYRVEEDGVIPVFEDVPYDVLIEMASPVSSAAQPESGTDYTALALDCEGHDPDWYVSDLADYRSG
jgi:hypothetical protein